MAKPITLGVGGGDYMDSATVVRWLKEPGEEVSEGEPVLEVETAKALAELSAPCDGVLLAQSCATGVEARVGSVVGWIGEAGEAVPTNDLPVAAPSASGIGPPGGNPTEPAGAAPTGRATPSARKLAGELGVDLASVTGTGPAGRIQNRDILAAAGQSPSEPTAAPSSDVGYEVTPLDGYRRSMAALMAESSTVPQLHVRRNVDATLLTANRGAVSVTVMMLAALGRALTRHPLLNSHWVGGELRRFPHADIAIGMATERGLVAPVLHRVEELDQEAIATGLKQLREAAAAGRLTQADLGSGTFTISNLGPQHIDEFAALVTPPQVGALAVGAIQPDGRMALTLSADHRVVDGADAAAFMATLAELIEERPS